MEQLTVSGVVKEGSTWVVLDYKEFQEVIKWAEARFKDEN